MATVGDRSTSTNGATVVGSAVAGSTAACPAGFSWPANTPVAASTPSKIATVTSAAAATKTNGRRDLAGTSCLRCSSTCSGLAGSASDSSCPVTDSASSVSITPISAGTTGGAVRGWSPAAISSASINSTAPAYLASGSLASVLSRTRSIFGEMSGFRSLGSGRGS